MSFPDGSEFMTSAALNEEDRKFLSEAFWDQRWWRLAERAWPWAATAVAVPFAAFVLGAALLWVASGFRTR